MKLDDTVCRGSLIIHKGGSYVVLGVSKYWRVDVKFPVAGWKIIPTPKDGVWCISAFEYADEDCDVDTFFPGAVFEIPDYIR